MSAPRLGPHLTQTIKWIVGEAPLFEDDWWIIGSAAAALSGAEISGIRDVDLLLSERDARGLFERWGRAPQTPAPDPQFRSTLFERFLHSALPIDAFAGFEIRQAGKWRPVRLQTREQRGGCFTASIAEQIALLQAMGRPKDGERIRALQALL